MNYKKTTLRIVIVLTAVFITVIICFLTNPANEGDRASMLADSVEMRTASSEGETQIPEQVPDDKISVNTEGFAKSMLSQAEKIVTEQDSIQEGMLYEQPADGKICIEVQPSMLREHLSYYYVPADEEQKWLSEQIELLDLEGESQGMDRDLKGYKETGWHIIYENIYLMGLEGGYLYGTYYDDENRMIERLIEAPELCGYIQAMLAENIGYQTYDISDIKNIVSAKLDVNSIFTGWQFYSQTITDIETLKKFEEWFRNAEYIFGGADCGNECACLELTLANGHTVKLSMATDSCSNFSINGVAYDYRPVPVWDNSEFFKHFNEIPWEY